LANGDKETELDDKTLQEFLTWRAKHSKLSFALQEYQGNPGILLHKLLKLDRCRAFEPRNQGNDQRELGKRPHTWW
jgi:hypothetical protein